MNIFKIILTFLILLSANLSKGQFDKGRDQFKGQLDSIMKEKLSATIGIDETTADKFFEKYKENNNQIRELKKEKKELMRSIEADPSAADIDTKLNKLMSLETDINNKRNEFIQDLKTILTPQQIAETIIFMKDFSKEFRNELKKNRKKNRSMDNDLNDNDLKEK